VGDGGDAPCVLDANEGIDTSEIVERLARSVLKLDLRIQAMQSWREFDDCLLQHAAAGNAQFSMPSEHALDPDATGLLRCKGHQGDLFAIADEVAGEYEMTENGVDLVSLERGHIGFQRLFDGGHASLPMMISTSTCLAVQHVK
jgi:hypothetical protein